MEGSKFILVGAVLAFCAFILQVIGLASPYWVTYDFGSSKAYIGLWKFCVKTMFDTKCVDASNLILKEWLSAVKAMSIMGLLALTVALGMAGLKLFVMKENKVLQLVAITVTFAAAVFILISIAVYAAKMNDLVYPTILKYHFAFAFCIIAMLSAIGAGCLMLKDAML